MDAEKTDTKWQARGLALIAWVGTHPATSVTLAAAGMLGTFIFGLVLGVAIG